MNYKGVILVPRKDLVNQVFLASEFHDLGLGCGPIH